MGPVAEALTRGAVADLLRLSRQIMDDCLVTPEFVRSYRFFESMVRTAARNKNPSTDNLEAVRKYLAEDTKPLDYLALEKAHDELLSVLFKWRYGD